MSRESRPIPTSVQEIVKYHNLESINGFEAPTCYRAEPNWMARLIQAQQDRYIEVQTISVGVRGNTDYEANTFAVQKVPPFGEPTYLCTTGRFAGFLAAPMYRISKKDLTLEEIEEDDFPWAYAYRPLLLRTSDVIADVDVPMGKYIQNGVLRVGRPIETILQRLGVPLDIAIFRANIRAFTNLEAASMVEYTL